MWHTIGQVVSLVEKPWEIEGRTGISRRLTFAVEGFGLSVVTLSDEALEGLGSLGYSDLGKFGQWVRIVAQETARAGDPSRPLRASSVQLLDAQDTPAS